MELLRELIRRQDELGWLSDDTLRSVSRERRVPLYRLEGLVTFYPYFRRTPPPAHVIHVCRDLSCAMRGCGRLKAALETRLAAPAAGESSADDSNLQPAVEIHEVSCIGRCDTAPGISINDVPLIPDACQHAALSDDERINAIVEQVAGIMSGTAPLPDMTRATSRGPWRCDPYESQAEQYGTVLRLAADGDPPGDQCVQRLLDAGLRGMGGAGFPTGRKWDLVRREERSPRYVICNADESEPGTFKDRVILEELPHLVIEGMLLAALTIGAETGIIYLRHEYGREQLALQTALDEARSRGILGDNAAGSGQRFDIEIFVSPGGYILGEETALLEALEDRRGEPRLKPPYPVTHGLYGQPTLINNVETFALATSIISHGPQWWREQGRDGFQGLKFVSISGDVAHPGVFEIPLGMPVSELIELAGGLTGSGRLLAFLPGGASSNFLPADHVDTPLDFDRMKAAGSMLGTGAVVVITDQHDLFAVATNIVRFFRNESCGKCVPCRLGSQRAVRLLEEVSAGNISADTLTELHDLGDTLQQTSICGLGQVAINPALSLLKNFPNCIPTST